MKVVIAGSRTINDYGLLLDAIDKSEFDIEEVIYGGASGVDAMGRRYADERALYWTLYEADWEKHGRAAGPIRNRLMAQRADAAIVLIAGNSRGSRNMIEEMEKLGKPVFVMEVDA